MANTLDLNYWNTPAQPCHHRITLTLSKIIVVVIDDISAGKALKKWMIPIYSTFLNIDPFTPQTGHFSGASRSTVMPQTGQKK